MGRDVEVGKARPLRPEPGIDFCKNLQWTEQKVLYPG
jgi:hypothetical protein